MKILAIAMLLSVAGGIPIWDFIPWRKGPRAPEEWHPPLGHPPPLERPFPPPGHFQAPRGHRYTAAKGMQWTPCQVLELFFQLYLNQPAFERDRCTVGWVCNAPPRGDVIITTVDGLQITVQHPNLHVVPNPDEARDTGKPMGDNPVQENPDGPSSPNENSTYLEDNPVTPQTDDNEPSRQHGGEGLIDVRIGE